MNRPLFQYQPQPQQPSVVSGVRWASLTVALLISTLILIGICGAAVYFGVDSEHRQNAEERVIDALALKEQDDVNALAASDAEILAELLMINATLTNDITFLAAALNLTSYNGQTFVQQIQAQIAADVSTLDVTCLGGIFVTMVLIAVCTETRPQAVYVAPAPVQQQQHHVPAPAVVHTHHHSSGSHGYGNYGHGSGYTSGFVDATVLSAVTQPRHRPRSPSPVRYRAPAPSAPTGGSPAVVATSAPSTGYGTTKRQ